MDTQDRLTGVPETMLLTLYHRALETQRPDRLFADEYAVALVGLIDHDFGKFDDWRMRWAIPVRTWLIDIAVRHFLDHDPDGTVVTLGAGLCTRALRLDNGRARWFSVDLESVAPYWRTLIGDSAHNHFIAESITDPGWIDAVPTEADGHGMLFVAEGVLQYLPEPDVRRVLLTIRDRFPGAHLVMDLLGEFTVRNTQLNPTVAATGSQFRWGLNDGRELESWGEGIELLDQWYQLDYARERQGYMARLPQLLGGKGQFGKVVHLRLGKGLT